MASSSPTNLAALRELALQTVAERIDRDVREVMRSQGVTGPWPVRARIVVAIDGIGNGEELVRLGRRLAERRRAPMERGVRRSRRHRPGTAGRCRADLRAGRAPGGETLTLRGHDPVEEVLTFAREQNATTLVVGRSRHRPLTGLFCQTLSQRLLRRGEDFEMTFVSSRVAQVRRRRRWFRRLEPMRDYVLTLAVVAAATGLAAAIEPLVLLPSLSLVFLIAVLLVAVRTAMRPALIAAVLSAATYNFFFHGTAFHFRHASSPRAGDRRLFSDHGIDRRPVSRSSAPPGARAARYQRTDPAPAVA
ncbi:MAG: DUF4118 domain-containing protein [Chromatiales bacterium]|nr:DUF4118 domain-containing protein [Chromatiales bacterium]